MCYPQVCNKFVVYSVILGDIFYKFYYTSFSIFYCLLYFPFDGTQSILQNLYDILSLLYFPTCVAVRLLQCYYFILSKYILFSVKFVSLFSLTQPSMLYISEEIYVCSCMSWIIR